MSTSGQLLSGRRESDRGPWWTDTDCLMTRTMSAATVEPYLPDTRQYSYTINPLPDPTDDGGGPSPRSGSPPPPFEDRKVMTDSRSSVGSPDATVVADPVARGRAGRRETLLDRRRSEWRREFDLPDEWSETWRDYRLHSSIHGVKHAAEPQPFWLRRAIWIVLLLSAAAVFLYMMSEAIRVYFTWPVVLHVNTVYQTSIRFPAVTLCNQNAFRVTASAENDWYEILSEMYSKDTDLAFLETWGASNVSMLDIYSKTAHRKEDMILSCSWDGQPCGVDDFRTVLTDYGVCYSFNSGPGVHRLSTHTGAGSGLKLLVNIEQYEYMAGPSDGAGLKILVHNQEDFPLVRDNGFTLPKGSHSFVGLKHAVTTYLPPPYGQCDDSGSLLYYDVYSRGSCLEECKQVFLQMSCGCKLFYMPSTETNDSAPVCTLGQYKSCIQPANARFRRSQMDICECSMACTQATYETVTSLGAVSSFEVLNMMYSSERGHLEHRLLEARRVTDRVIKKVAEADTSLIREFTKAVNDIDAALHVLMRNLATVVTEVDQILAGMNVRTWFHQNAGFRRMANYLDHAFTRGWNAQKERALDHLAANLFALADTYDHVVVKINDENIDMSSKTTLWLVLDNELRGRIDLTRKAQEYVEDTYNAFLTGTPIIPSYKETVDGHFDSTFIDVNLLAGEITGSEGAASWAKDRLIENIANIKTDINAMQRFSLGFFKNRTQMIDRRASREAVDQFIQTSRAFISTLLLFEARIVANLPEVLGKKIDDFAMANRTLYNSRTDLGIVLSTIQTLVQSFNATVWPDIMDKAATSQLYLDDMTTAKADLAKELTSKGLQEKLGDFNIFFNAIRARGRDLTDRMMEVKRSYQDLWKNMLQETSLEAYYEKISEAYGTYTLSLSESDNRIINDYADLLSDLLAIPQKDFKQLEVGDLRTRLNADFHLTDWDTKMSEIDEMFNGLLNSTDITGMVENLDLDFERAFEKYESSMKQFVKSNKMEDQFYLDNMMRVDVYMQDLNSDDIVHQPTYDYIHLLGDIGGLFSLFLGASLLSIVELVDLFVHHLFKWIMAHNFSS